MSNWTLENILNGVNQDIQQRLEIVRKSLNHPGTKGDASEKVWLDLLKKYLPIRYQAEKAFVVDSNGVFSEQMDVVIFDRQYSPFIFNYEGAIIVPAESVYAVFEAKQTINAGFIEYAQEKVQSVRLLHRTSLPIPHAGGTYPPKPLIPIIGGILTFESDWNPALGKPLEDALTLAKFNLNLGCIATHGYFFLDENLGEYSLISGSRPATSFLFKLISLLQFSGTVPMIDIMAYSRWI